MHYSALALAAPCEDNFKTINNQDSGISYKTWADVPGVDATGAFNNMATFTTTYGFKILSSDKSKGSISAVQAGSYEKGRIIPLDILMTPSSNGVQVSMVYTTPPGVISPEAAIKNHFCKTIEAAGQAQKGSSALASAPATSQSKDGKISTGDTNTAPSTEYVKNGMPCLNGICIGDDISLLKQVKWETVYTPPYPLAKPQPLLSLKISEDSFKRISKGFAPGANTETALRAALPYLDKRSFDSDGIPKLERLKAYCAPVTVYGQYKSESGFDTVVEVELISETDPNKQALRVTSISRNYPIMGYTREQVQEREKQFMERYASIKRFAPIQSAATALFTPYWNIMGNSLTLSSVVNVDVTNQLKKYPGCGHELKLD